MPPPTTGPQNESAAILLGVVDAMRTEMREDAATTRTQLGHIERALSALNAAHIHERLEEHAKRLRDLELTQARTGAVAGVLGGVAGALLSALLSWATHR